MKQISPDDVAEISELREKIWRVVVEYHDKGGSPDILFSCLMASIIRIILLSSISEEDFISILQKSFDKTAVEHYRNEFHRLEKLMNEENKG